MKKIYHHKKTFIGVMRLDSDVALMEWEYGIIRLIIDDEVYAKNEQWLVDMYLGWYDENV